MWSAREVASSMLAVLSGRPPIRTGLIIGTLPFSFSSFQLALIPGWGAAGAGPGTSSLIFSALCRQLAAPKEGEREPCVVSRITSRECGNVKSAMRAVIAGFVGSAFEGEDEGEGDEDQVRASWGLLDCGGRLLILLEFCRWEWWGRRLRRCWRRKTCRTWLRGMSGEGVELVRPLFDCKASHHGLMCVLPARDPKPDPGCAARRSRGDGRQGARTDLRRPQVRPPMMEACFAQLTFFLPFAVDTSTSCQSSSSSASPLPPTLSTRSSRDGAPISSTSQSSTSSPGSARSTR